MKNLSAGRDLRISGYASLFDHADLSGDIVRRGAFSASLLSLSGRGSFPELFKGLPMLLGHDTSEPIGVWDRVSEDRKGLFVSGVIMAGEARAERAARMVKRGALSGLSIGYKPVRTRQTQSQTQMRRELLEVDLWEVSIVAFPMLRSARITQIGDQELDHPLQNLTPQSHTQMSA